MNILHIDSSPRGAQSYTRKMTAEVVAALKENNEDATIVYRDLGQSAAVCNRRMGERRIHARRSANARAS